MKNGQWLLARRPPGAIQDSDFNFVETDAPTPGEGEVLVRNLMLSCDPTQRGWIAGWVQSGQLKTKVDTQHGLENAPATLGRLFEGPNDGEQFLRVAESSFPASSDCLSCFAAWR
jgi:NADPH-dependent curcumin reductase CurA